MTARIQLKAAIAQLLPKARIVHLATHAIAFLALLTQTFRLCVYKSES
ncbi:hypothetical protein F7734_59400 [Scytonema sp. UIC 10036]|nr:hypothetical protein [Scytonema sp. UIC 10036]MUH01703.1 hypothetical protein [Scytonema sp. UIC 10036]